MIGPGLLVGMIAMDLDHAIALILVGVAAGFGRPAPGKVLELGIAQLIRHPPPIAAPVVAELPELCAPHGIATVKIIRRRLFAKDASM